MKRIFIIVMTCLVLLSSTTSVWAQSTPAIKIVKPGDRRNMGLGETTVIVEITGIDPKQVTWQVLVDSVPLATVTDGGTTAIIDMPKPTGPRHIRAVMYDKANQEIASNEIMVIAAPIDTRESLFNQPAMAPAMFIFAAIVTGLLVLAFVISRRTRHQPIHSIPGVENK